ncbi:hypothetical protein M409DRAFT_22782 [Zasmidium cellare ATCC 36951]|uniref:Uncharacterized protein n=1 Tax=Zasmidium cellare ATCC 36951 TaxID=1080233 RepID=A0A6A6CHV9_ZASCE|nr:uncharacterized protein M409DRAFT_22782 [Zasmidium cellare ATCC 36951]KAF2166725.1 hypothetical protein M409DRAFT_22782 [Zasmidium cellare ATCC 36951]
MSPSLAMRLNSDAVTLDTAKTNVQASRRPQNHVSPRGHRNLVFPSHLSLEDSFRLLLLPITLHQDSAYWLSYLPAKMPNQPIMPITAQLYERIEVHGMPMLRCLVCGHWNYVHDPECELNQNDSDDGEDDGYEEKVVPGAWPVV